MRRNAALRSPAPRDHPACYYSREKFPSLAHLIYACDLASRGPALSRSRRQNDMDCDRTERKRTVLLVTDQIPGHQIGAQRSGSALAVSSYIAHFNAKSWPVTVLLLRPRLDFCFAHAAHFPYRLRGPGIAKLGGSYFVYSIPSILATAGWKLYSNIPAWMSRYVVRFRDFLRSRRGIAHVLGRMPTHRESELAQAIARQENPDVVLYDGIFNVCEPLAGATHWVITHDVKYLRARSFRRRGYSVLPLDLTQQKETDILRGVGNVIAIQHEEAAVFKRLLPRARVVVVPVPFERPRLTRPAAVSSLRCIFVASGSFHNIDGLQWFLNECWGSIRNAVIGATLDIYGSVCFRLGTLPDGATAYGVVDDITHAYTTASVALIPLRVGSGLKVKILEALAHGVPAVATSVGAQGLAHYSPLPFLVGDSAQTFAQAVIRVLRSPELQRVLQARALEVARDFRPYEAFREFDEALGHSYTNVDIGGNFGDSNAIRYRESKAQSN
jgi:glycosyltransferase involved in cell wall biosynthesis